MAEKLKYHGKITGEEEKLILRLEESRVNYAPGELIRRKGEPIENIFIVSEGWTYISSSLDKNVRSIFDFRFDGDFIGIAELSFDFALYDIIALTDTVICPFPKSNLDEIFSSSARLCNIFYSMLSREQALLYERIISLGRRTALEKVANFILEIAMRTNTCYPSISEAFHFPIKQDLIGDLLGLSSIQVNRSMNELKRYKHIEYDRTQLKILDWKRLAELTGFNADFLQHPVQSI